MLKNQYSIREHNIKKGNEQSSFFSYGSSRNHLSCAPPPSFFNHLDTSWKERPQSRNYLQQTAWRQAYGGIFLITDWCSAHCKLPTWGGSSGWWTTRLRAGEMSQRLWALAAVPEDLWNSLIPSTHRAQFTTFCNPVTRGTCTHWKQSSEQHSFMGILSVLGFRFLLWVPALNVFNKL